MVARHPANALVEGDSGSGGARGLVANLEPRTFSLRSPAKPRTRVGCKIARWQRQRGHPLEALDWVAGQEDPPVNFASISREIIIHKSIFPTLYKLTYLQEDTINEEVAERLARSHQGEPGSILGLVTGFSHVGIVPDDAVCRRVFSETSRFSRPSFLRSSILTSISLIDSQDLVVKSRPNLFIRRCLVGTRHDFRKSKSNDFCPAVLLSSVPWEAICGRPRRRWMACVKEDLREKQLNENDIWNRAKWKILARNVDPTRTRCTDDVGWTHPLLRSSLWSGWSWKYSAPRLASPYIALRVVIAKHVAFPIFVCLRHATIGPFRLASIGAIVCRVHGNRYFSGAFDELTPAAFGDCPGIRPDGPQANGIRSVDLSSKACAQLKFVISNPRPESCNTGDGVFSASGFQMHMDLSIVMLG
ncbi:hypothetical protein PR048_013743 [Dryococelus australis]|uniref:Uncharacterized protein n=1 Tax=Dryococelus australis TaxID=614101 RepID=A0ABQ9HTH4_9NEOP|nr:hypothetical protein PR048_013743 [Dryococelus australis]